jgi:NADH-quinone oxidoreductase subunit M
MIQMISHGFISGAMFMCIGVLYDRVHSRNIADYGGVLSHMPKYGAFAIFFAMANAGLPGTSGFVGEFMVILAALQANFWIAFLAALTLILGAAYTLWLVKRVLLGPVELEHVKNLLDLDKIEYGLLAILAIFTLLLGLWPQPLVNVMSATLDQVVQLALVSKL